MHSRPCKEYEWGIEDAAAAAVEAAQSSTAMTPSYLADQSIYLSLALSFSLKDQARVVIIAEGPPQLAGLQAVLNECHYKFQPSVTG